MIPTEGVTRILVTLFCSGATEPVVAHLEPTSSEQAMKILAVRVKGFRSVESAELLRCGGMNVLIGKNNAGKSNLLSAIELVINHLRRGVLAAPWQTQRPADEFTSRDLETPLEVGIEFVLPPTLNERLRSDLGANFPQLAKSAEQLVGFGSASFIIAAVVQDGEPFTYIRQIGVGSIENGGHQLRIQGTPLVTLTQNVAFELNLKYIEASGINTDIGTLEDILSDRRSLDRAFQTPKDNTPPFAYSRYAVRARREVLRDLDRLYASAKTVEDFVTAVADYVAKLRQMSSDVSKKEISGTIKTYGGESKLAPPYAVWLMEVYGSVRVIHFRENKQSLGREEAEKLLQLKNRRGGPQQLNALQQTIKGLLGVHVDAFKEGDQAPAEMDVDQFLVEANGAGIREALRIVLDLELRNPQLVLIEEPEVHLHPGLARVVANYLRQKSTEIQMFVTTHSTEFVDSVSFQNAYLVGRNSAGNTVCQLVEAEEEALRIPGELGLRLSTVFMFDRLVFVEGPSDETVLRIFAETCGVDLASCNIGFVHMGGVRNFAHYAAEGTLDLLSRRQVMMWFVVDRDEMEDREVKRMLERLGPRAKLQVLRRRELENYLCDGPALTKFVVQKLKSSGKGAEEPASDAVCRAIQNALEASKADVVRLRLAKHLLSPIYLRTNKGTITAEETLKNALGEINTRLASISDEKAKTEQEVDACWASDADKLAPGCIALDRAAQSFGVRFLKENGDSEKLARLVAPKDVHNDILSLLEEFTKGGG